MKISKFFLLGTFLFFFSCSSVRYISDHLENHDYPQKGTYSVEGECEKEVSRIQEIRVSNAIHKAMQSNGFQRSQNPDLLVQYFIKEQTESYLTTECDYYGRWAFGEHCSTRVVNYREGTIVVDIVDTDSQTIIWHGAIYGPPFDNLKDPGKKINKYIHTLLEDNYFQ